MIHDVDDKIRGKPIKHYLNILRSTTFKFADIQLMVGYRLSNIKSRITLITPL
jgi:hypothetical protein